MDSRGGLRSPDGNCIADGNEATPAMKSTHKNPARKPSKRGRGFAHIQILSSSDSSPDNAYVSSHMNARTNVDSLKNNLFPTKVDSFTKTDSFTKVNKDSIKQHRTTPTDIPPKVESPDNCIATNNLKSPPELTYARKNNSATKFTTPSGKPTIMCRSSNNSDTGWLSRNQEERKAPNRAMSTKQVEEKLFRKFRESEMRAGWPPLPDHGYNNYSNFHDDSDSSNDDVALMSNSMKQSNTRQRMRGRRHVRDRDVRKKQTGLCPESTFNSNANDVGLERRRKRGRRRIKTHHSYNMETPNSGSDSDSSTNHQATTNFDPKNWGPMRDTKKRSR